MSRSAAAIVILMVAVTACSGAKPSPVAAVSPSSSASAPSPSTDTPASPTSVPDLPLTAVGFTCRLPVLVTTQNADGSSSFQGGFVTFPRASYQADPNGVVLAQPSGGYVTKASPVLSAFSFSGPPFYDLAMKRWLPVGSGQTAPDGLSYAYVSPRTGGYTWVNVVQVASGTIDINTTTSIVPPPSGVGWQLKDYDGKLGLPDRRVPRPVSGRRVAARRHRPRRRAR